MKKLNKMDRKTFIKASGAAVFGAAFGNWSIAGASLKPASICIGHITDTFFMDTDDPEKSGRRHHGWLYGHARALADDLTFRFREEGPTDIVVHSGNLLRSGKPEQALAARDWIKSHPGSFMLTLGKSDSGSLGMNREEFISKFSTFCFYKREAYYSYDLGGFHFIHLESPFGKLPEQQNWLVNDLAKHKNTPTIIVVHEQLHNRLFAKYPQVILMLSGGTYANTASFDSGMLSLGTCSPVKYPCGARMIKIEISGGTVSIKSEFIQTRHLELVEKSFHYSHSRKQICRLGERNDRRFIADSGKRIITPFRYETNPALAPRVGSDSSVVLALLTDTHLCLDKYVFGEEVTQHKESLAEYELSGHSLEKDSKAIYRDILDQVVQGRHRVEFYDEVFAKNPDADAHYLDMPVDVLQLNGDLSEHSMYDESEIVLEGLNELPEKLRRSTYVTPGNHDLYRGGFIEKDSTSSRKPFADFYKDYVSPDGSTYFTVELAEWLTMIVLDSVIPTHSSLGVIQEQIDWLEDQIASREKQAVIVTCHHPLYPVSQVPRAMSTYLKIRSHFTPKATSARVQLHKLFARHNNVKLLLSGHYHGTCTDQYKKANPRGNAYDDLFTTHIQVPCTVEYPNGYRIFKISRSGKNIDIDYVTAYTRLADVRTKSSRARLFQALGTDIKAPKNYGGTLGRLYDRKNILRSSEVINPIDLTDFNVRGYKDGTVNNGRGNSGKNNINGKIQVTI